MAQSKEGFSISGSTLSGVNLSQGDNNHTVQGDGNQAVLGDNNQVQQSAGAEAEALTQADVVELLAQIEALIENSSLPEDVKDEAATYAKAAKKATEKDEPKKDRVVTNLKGIGETLTEAGNTVEAAKGLWKTILPIALKVGTWFGIAALFG